MDQKGLMITKSKGKVTITKLSGNIIMEGNLRKSLYELDCAIAPSATHSDVAFQATNSDRTWMSNIDLWHACFAHPNETSLRYLAKNKIVDGLDLTSTGSLSPCNSCAKGKHPSVPFPKQATNHTRNILGRLHMDLQGPFNTSIKGYCYALVVVDDHSRKGWKEFIKHKNDVVERIKTLLT